MNEPNQPYTDVLILGGGLGGVAAALAAVEGGAAVVLVEGDRLVARGSELAWPEGVVGY